MTANAIELDKLKATIDAKWEANQATLERSLQQGVITWRRRRDGRFEVKLKPDL